MKKIFLYILPLLLLASCANDDLSVSSSQDDTEGVKATFSLKVDNSSAFATRSSTNAAIDTALIKNVWVVQFTYTADGTGGVMGTPQYLDNVTDFSSSNMEVKLKEGTSNVYFVANTFNSATFNSANCATEASFRNLTKSFTTDTVMQNELVNSNQCVPMTGVLTNETVSGTAAVTKTVNMYRSAALVDFNYSIAFPTGQSFEVTGIRVCNVPKKMYYAKPSSTSFASTDYYDYPLEDVLTANSQAGHALFYVPDNLCGTGAANSVPTNKAGIDGKYCTYVELRGKSGDGRYMIYKVYLGKDSVMDYNVERNNYYKVDLTLKGISAYDACMLSGNIMSEEANCYMITPGKTILIPVSRANAYAVSRGSSKPIVSGTRWTAEMLWTDNVNGIKPIGTIENVTADVSGGYVWVRAGKAVGNSVICIKNSAGNILWSWHLWVTDYVPKTIASIGGTTNIYNGTTWMDRNIGATSSTTVGTNLGLIYQWGRKDPFPGGDGADATTARKIFNASGVEISEANAAGIKIAGGAVDVSLSVLNPMTFYLGGTSADWCYSSGWPSFWGGADWTSTPLVTKGLYDPCPPGWRIPSFNKNASPLAGLTGSNGIRSGVAGSGNWDWRSQGAGLFPASGYRASSDGVLRNVGTEVGCWSGSTSIPGGVDWWQGVMMSGLSDGTVNMTRYNIGTSLGFSARCVKE